MNYWRRYRQAPQTPDLDPVSDEAASRSFAVEPDVTPPAGAHPRRVSEGLVVSVDKRLVCLGAIEIKGVEISIAPDCPICPETEVLEKLLIGGAAVLPLC